MDYSKYKLFVFDLDGTLAPSKFPMDEEMAELLVSLLRKRMVVVTSGAKFSRFEEQLLVSLDSGYENLHLFPTNGTEYRKYENGEWIQVYYEPLSDEESQKIFDAFEKAFEVLEYKHPKKHFGEFIENRGGQVTFSAVGQEAPLEEKLSWRKDNLPILKKISVEVGRLLPDFEVKVAGTTSVDVTHHHIDKKYAVEKMKEYFDLGSEDIIFIGDALEEGSNDYPALLAGVQGVQVEGVEDTKKLLVQILSQID
ncbi:HAD-IIB family hydrolase [Patescibacteria group bacterium]